MKRTIFLIFGEPLGEVFARRIGLRYPIAFLGIARLDVFAFTMCLWVAFSLVRPVLYRQGRWTLRSTQSLDHGRVEPGASFFISDLTDKIPILV
jgi:hypothetical protein